MSDLTFHGGKFGMWVGNQQYALHSFSMLVSDLDDFNRFTVQNVTMNNCKTAVFGIWNWGELKFTMA